MAKIHKPDTDNRLYYLKQFAKKRRFPYLEEKMQSYAY